jgi:hypothetical protein
MNYVVGCGPKAKNAVGMSNPRGLISSYPLGPVAYFQNATASEACDDGESHCVLDGVDAGEVCTVHADCRGTCSGAAPNPGFRCTTATVAEDCGSLSGCDVTLDNP